MFRVTNQKPERLFRWGVFALLIMSAAALGITIWVMIDFLKEQEILSSLLRQIPEEYLSLAKELQGELRWHFRLSILVVLNLIITGFAIVLLWRAYSSSLESLRDVKALAGDVLSSMDLGVLTTDLNGTITSINRRGLELLDLTGDEVGRKLGTLTGSNDLDQLRQDSLALGSSKLMRDIIPSITKTHPTPRTFRAFCQPLNDYSDQEVGSIVQIRDVSERVLIEDRMRRMERYMGLGSLAVGLHHEIKNPLAALSLHVQLLEEHLNSPQTDDETPSPMLQVIKTEVRRITGVLENFRNFASLDRLVLSTVNLINLLEHQLQLIKPQAESANISVILDFPEQSLPEIKADGTRLEQVLLNLALNAIDAMPKGGNIRIVPSERIIEGLRQVQIEVSDTGHGIPENIHSQIFEPYFSTKSQGTGMGLAISEKIINQHKGTLLFTTSSEGTTFTITLPVTSK